MINLRHHIGGILTRTRPDVTVLYMSSDVSNVIEELMTPLRKLQTRLRYQADLVNVTREVVGYGSKLAIIGPGILGEQVFKPLRSGEVRCRGRVIVVLQQNGRTEN